MNSDEIDRYLRDFDGVFSVDNLSKDSRLLVFLRHPWPSLDRYLHRGWSWRLFRLVCVSA